MVERSGSPAGAGPASPARRKMRSVAGQRGPAVVLANGAEREPASGKDRLLLTRAAAPGHGRDNPGRGRGRGPGGHPLRAPAGDRPAGQPAPGGRGAGQRRNRPGADRDSRDPRPVRVQRADRDRRVPGRRPRQAGFHPAPARRTGAARPSHAGEQRRDAGPPGADRPLRGWLVPQHRASLGGRLGPGHRERGRHPPRRLRGRARHRPRGRRHDGRRPGRAPAGAARRRLLRRLAARRVRVGHPAEPARRCARRAARWGQAS